MAIVGTTALCARSRAMLLAAGRRTNVKSTNATTNTTSSGFQNTSASASSAVDENHRTDPHATTSRLFGMGVGPTTGCERNAANPPATTC